MTGQLSRDAEIKPPAAPRLLVVDDEAAARHLLRLVLGDAGFEIVEAASARQALQALTQGVFDLVLLDERMPRMGGLELLRVLRGRPDTATLPIILVTSADDLDDRVAGLDGGATDYVTKPFEAEEVVARVRAQLRSRDAWRGVVADVLAERTAVVEALGRAAFCSTPEARAQAICEEVCVLGGVEGASLVTFALGGGAVPLAQTTPGVWRLETGEPAPAALARYLGVRAGIGPWVERGEVDPLAEATSDTLLLEGSTVTCAPISVDGQTLGLLLLATKADASAVEVSAILSASIDFAKVAASLLGEPLITRRQHQAERLDLFSILARGAFTPHFQPIVALDTGTTVGFEALTRFDDGTPPDVRFAEAATAGLGADLEAATITAAIRAADLLPAHRWVAINLSPTMLLDAERLADLINETDRDLVLELSEHDPVDDYDALRAALQHPRLDTLLSVDDAGSGFASLRHILILEPAFIKLDRSWVHTIDTDPARQALVAGLQSFASKTGCRLIAEGIETQAEHDVLLELGVPFGQGYLLGRPAPAR